MTRAEILALLDERQAAIARRDVEALVRLHAEDCVLESLTAGTVKGRAATGEVYRAWFSAFPDMALTTDHVVIDGDRAVLVSTVTGTDSGGFLGLPPSHKPFRVAIVQFYTFEDGSISHARHIYDFTGLLLQIGVLKAKPA
ncbi:MAG: hypothetical protein A3I61_07185 [Acidobacteria bacterium RIFCSPLOWO2_02_FULL_68_18]|nr:MAG: hypothetical protein A3I61_07185 [Acidobacteria bacterium RIFCSPLOWO2_02_FULL_68_18]OFW51327.1 MAG: hypothetical protein A3G77_05750 [Acidobacteria bacterium RIFCSPLOWO2_12_FULL_68_19]